VKQNSIAKAKYKTTNCKGLVGMDKKIDILKHIGLTDREPEPYIA